MANEKPLEAADDSPWEMFVIVNVSKPYAYAQEWGEFYVMPGEEPHTFGSLVEAVFEQLMLMDEYGHNPYSAPIYRLVPVSDEKRKGVLEEAQRMFAKFQIQEDE